MFKYESNPEEWKTKLSSYYEILSEHAKQIFVRLPCGGSITPDSEWEPRLDRAKDVLPCMMQLRHEVRAAHAMLAEKNTCYQNIRKLARVTSSSNPDMAALAVFLMDAETRVMTEVRESVVRVGGHVISVVYDGLYVLCASEAELTSLYDAVAKGIYEGIGIKLSLKDAAGKSLKKFSL